MMIEQFRKNYEYNHWANDRYVKALAEMPSPPEKAVRILGHIIFALEVWLARLKGEDLARFTTPWPPLSLPECRIRLDELQESWRNYLASLKSGDLASRITYTNTQGKKFEQVVQNVLMHVVNHSTYHRGQLATLLAQAGGTRPETDYIGYVLKIGEARAL